MKQIKYIITSDENEKEIKELLINTLHLSSRLITALKKTENGILLNDEHATVRKKVVPGDLLCINLPEEKSENIHPVNIPLNIIYEDEDILVINKPSNLPTHPSLGHFEDTLANGVMYYYKDQNFVFRSVNRLDRDTTGLVLIAKNQYAANNLSTQIKDNKIKKTYLAICEGEFKKKTGTIIAPIKRESEGSLKRIVDENGQYAETDYTVLAYKDGCSLLMISLKTGRTHQIRVHMSHIRHPLYSDFLYGNEIENERIRLHCESLEFLHPTTKETLNLKAPLPTDFFIRPDE